MLLPLLLCALTQAPSPAPVGRLIVLNKAEASASLLDLATGAERARLPVGVGPHEVIVTADGGTAIVANYGTAVPGSSLTLIDLLAERPVRTLDLGQAARPHGIVAEADGAHVWVTAEPRAALLRVRLEDGAVVQEIPTPQPVGHMVAQGGGALFVSHIGGGGVTPVRPAPAADPAAASTSSWSAGAFVTTGAGAEGLAVTPNGDQLWVGNRAADSLTILRTADLTPLATLDAPGFPIRVAFTPDGSTALVSCAQAGVLRSYDVGERRETFTLDFAAQVQADRAEGRLLDEFGDSPVPIGIVVPPSGAHAYVALANADRIAEVDLAQRAVVRWLRAGREPDGMAWYPGPARQTR